MILTAGNVINTTSVMQRLVESIPTDYTVWYDATNSLYRAECNIAGGTDISGTNAGTVIQNALGGGNSVSVRDGDFNCGATTIDLGEGQGLLGTNYYKTRLYGTADPIIRINAKNYCELGNMQIDGLTSAVSGVYVTGSGADYSYYTRIHNLYLYRCLTGIYLRNAWEPWVNDVLIKSCTNGMYFYDKTSNASVRSAHIKDCTGVGLMVTNNSQVCEGLSFNDLLIYNCAPNIQIDDGNQIMIDSSILDGGATASHIRVYGGTEIRFSKTYLCGSNSATARVAVSPVFTTLSRVSFDKCTFSTNGYYGLYIYDDAGSARRPSKIWIKNCGFTSNGTAGGDGDLLIDDADTVRVVDNEFLSTATAAYNVAEIHTPTNVFVSGNTFAKGATGLLWVDGVNRFWENVGYVTKNSGTSTGTGAEETIAHGLDSTPTKITITPTATGATVTNLFQEAAANHFHVTVTNLKTYNWRAEAI